MHAPRLAQFGSPVACGTLCFVSNALSFVSGDAAPDAEVLMVLLLVLCALGDDGTVGAEQFGDGDSFEMNEGGCAFAAVVAVVVVLDDGHVGASPGFACARGVIGPFADRLSFGFIAHPDHDRRDGRHVAR